MKFLFIFIFIFKSNGARVICTYDLKCESYQIITGTSA